MLRLILLVSVYLAMANDVYTEASVYNCKVDPPYTVEQRREILTLYPIDRWIYTTFEAPFSMAISLVTMWQFIRNRSLFGMPGDTLFVLSLMDLFKAYQEFSSGVYAIVYDIAPNPYSAFCQINGIISAITFVLINLYLLIFASYPFILMYNALESSTKILRVFNIVFTFIIVVPFMAVVITTQSISISLNGMCTVSATSILSDYVFGISYLIALICFVGITLVFLISFKRLVPKSSGMRALRGTFLRFYQRFMIFTIVMRLLIGLCDLIDFLNCMDFLDPYVNIVQTVENTLIANYTLGCCLFITTDPLLRYRIYDFYYRKRKVDTAEGDGNASTQNTEMMDMDPLRELHTQMKTAQVYSILSGILILRKQKGDNLCSYKDLGIEEQSSSSDTKRSTSGGDLTELVDICSIAFKKEECDECQMITINQEMVERELNHLPNMQCFTMKCVLYAPKLFKHFAAMEGIDLENSFDLKSNEQKIRDFAGPDGGKSGEFFFFSHDNKLILKTMRYSELMALRKRLLGYGNYLNAFKDSLIAKIYGLYTFERQELNKPKIHLVLMKNISMGIPRKFIKRIFDMKGSEYDREVLAKEKNADLTKVTLKDIDFLKTEQKLWVSLEKNISISETLTRDSTMLMKMQLIDYSLLVLKIDWIEAGWDVEKYLDPNCNMITASTKEQGIYYHIAIIDYLQEWNVNKGMERATKRVINMNNKLDTSAQEPETYAIRFQQKLINRILPI